MKPKGNRRCLATRAEIFSGHGFIRIGEHPADTGLYASQVLIYGFRIDTIQ
jgi:hypothetical protein